MPRVDFFTLLPDASADAVDLLGRMLALDPDDRISVCEALEHPYVQDSRDPEGEPVADHVVGVDAEEEAATSLDDWRESYKAQKFAKNRRFRVVLVVILVANRPPLPLVRMENEIREIKPGYHTVELNRTVWAVPVYYQNLTPIGTGAYGTVWELRLLRNMDHENVIDMLDVFTPDASWDQLTDV
ncbi:hypothetical protein ANCCEY_04302 [Ancylostoma ceylanicum]|uniref:Protein kinase domain-containing protein n=1 Tax=Ancylostoma ceylanicum TaxID=53326 RepID=A0A0D6LZF9_9BILA|nr:hypothetical protein ANCCEY_04302 [Ancylostoma ceylanicum]